MPTSLSRYFFSSSSSPPSPSSYVMHQLNLLPNNSPRLLRQNAFVIDPANPHDPFEAPSRQSISDDNTLSPSDSFSDHSNETNPLTQQQPIVERIPLPENTADNDRPEPFDPHQHPYSHPLDTVCHLHFVALDLDVSSDLLYKHHAFIYRTTVGGRSWRPKLCVHTGIPMDMLETNVGGHVSYLHRMDHQRHHGIVLATRLEAAMTETVSGAIAITIVLCVLTLPPKWNTNVVEVIPTLQQQEPTTIELDG